MPRIDISLDHYIALIDEIDRLRAEQKRLEKKNDELEAALNHYERQELVW